MDDDFKLALKSVQNGTTIDLDVTPGSKQELFPCGYDQWRKRLGVKLTSAPQKGKANEQLARTIADFFSLPYSSVTITSGTKNTKKTVLIEGLSYEEIVLQLKRAL